MTSISLLVLLVVLSGLRLQLTNAAPGFSDRRQKLDLRDEDGSETSLLDKEKILEKLKQDGSMTFTSNGMVVQVTKDDDYVSNVSQDNENLPLDTRDAGATVYSLILMGPSKPTVHVKPLTFEQIMNLLTAISN